MTTKTMAYIEGVNSAHIAYTGGNPYHIGTDSHDDWQRGRNDGQARARLIDTAPETLRALKGLVAALVSPAVKDSELPALFANRPDAGAIVPALIDARAAIAKATGA